MILLPSEELHLNDRTSGAQWKLRGLDCEYVEAGGASRPLKEVGRRDNSTVRMSLSLLGITLVMMPISHGFHAASGLHTRTTSSLVQRPDRCCHLRQRVSW